MKVDDIIPAVILCTFSVLCHVVLVPLSVMSSVCLKREPPSRLLNVTSQNRETQNAVPYMLVHLGLTQSGVRYGRCIIIIYFLFL